MQNGVMAELCGWSGHEVLYSGLIARVERKKH